ncbi:coiled-coil alpha-helical rod protein 1 isoform X2 [Sphaeramia orbicularis]|uniref:Coiled-coil alpha-helical rod protein 1 n=1 Tax=Sphaeramia orbicularis TaxID=375764 RepID=A0A673BLE9_9TELE|nr:coiled-coil alpha-helical rod protein 1 isoform X2 [Sphaeramia orbicularis]
MEKHNLGKERLVVPTDFITPAVSGNVQRDLVPPSHFATSVHSTTRGVKMPVTAPPISWTNSGKAAVPPADPSHNNPWFAITQAQQEILELRKENQRIMMLQAESIRERSPADHVPVFRERAADRSEKWMSEWCLETEKHKAEAERLKGQVEAIKETADRHRDEMRDKDSIMNRQVRELEALREELCKTRSDLGQVREELSHSNAQQDKIRSQLENLNRDSSAEIAKLRRDAERSKEEVQALRLKADMSRKQAEEAAKQQILRLSEQLEDLQKNQEVELQQLNTSHCAELDAARKANNELQARLQSMASEVLQLKSSLIDASTERDGLKEHLSQIGQAFETQSATLQSLRNYIGQLAPEKGEKERLNEAVERLNKEKAALQMTTELLTIRLNSVNEILALQEEKMVKKTLTDPLVKNGSESLQVLQLWREKVFKLCVQLRSKDIELRSEKEELLSRVRSIEQQLQQEQHRATVLKHSLDDRIAELDLEKVEKETLKQDLALAQKENSQLKSQGQKAEDELATLKEAVQRFSLAFESKVAEVNAAQARLNIATQRLTFAKRQVETVQVLIMRRVALQKVQQASKQAEQAADSIRNLQTELSLVCEERDKLTQELKRTPELIEKALADLKEQYESRTMQQQQELEQSWMEVRQAVAGREEAQQSLQQIQAQLEESRVNLEKLRSELFSQQEHSEQALQERVSEIEQCCAEKLREMEVQVNTARREHTKAVMTLRHFERQAAKKQDHIKETEQREYTKREVQNKQLRDMEKDTNRLLLSGSESILMNDYTRTHTTAAQNSAVLREQGGNPSQRRSAGTKVQLPAGEQLMSVLEELQTLSATVVNSSEDSAEEEGQASTADLHS